MNLPIKNGEVLDLPVSSENLAPQSGQSSQLFPVPARVLWGFPNIWRNRDLKDVRNTISGATGATGSGLLRLVTPPFLNPMEHVRRRLARISSQSSAGNRR